MHHQPPVVTPMYDRIEGWVILRSSPLPASLKKLQISDFLLLPAPRGCPSLRSNLAQAGSLDLRKEKRSASEFFPKSGEKWASEFGYTSKEISVYWTLSL